MPTLSQSGGDLSKIQTGPCKLTADGSTLGHTMEGVRFNVAPDLRTRNVDEYGTHAADLIYQGETITVSTTLAEKTMAVLQTVYVWGYSVSTTLMGFGRVPGRKGSEVAVALVLHPLEMGASAAQDVSFHKCVVSESGEVQFGVITSDRVFAVTWTCLVDEAKTDGQLLGTIGAPAAA